MKGINKEYGKLPKCPFIGLFFNKYISLFYLENRRGSEGACKGHRSQEQEQEQNKKLCAFAEQKTPGCGGGDEFYLTAKKKKLKGKILEAFNAFWRAFDYPKGKASAADAFLAVYTPENIGEIIAGATAEAMERPMIIAGGKTPKWAQGWLTGRRWEDLKENAGQPPTIVLPEYVPPLKGGM